MNTDNATLVNKLILLVLSLIFVCLVLIVVRLYTERKLETAESAVAQASDASEEPAEPVVQVRPQTPIRRPTTNNVRSIGSVSPSPRADADRPVAEPSAEWPNSGTVNFQDNSSFGFGVVPGAATGSGGAELLSRATNGVEIVGVATLLGMPKPEVVIDLGPACGRLNRKRPTTRHYVVNSAGQLANVFVYISQGLTGQFPAPRKSVLLNQVGCMFEPYVFAVQTGQPLVVQNSDPEFHNVHVIPRLNLERNIGQARQGQVDSVFFKTPENFLRIKCDVHPWMFAYVSVLEHPFFSVTDTNGAFRLPPGLPAGRYTLTAAHLKAGTLAQEFEYRPGEPRAFSFQFVVPEATQAQR